MKPIELALVVGFATSLVLAVIAGSLLVALSGGVAAGAAVLAFHKESHHGSDDELKQTMRQASERSASVRRDLGAKR